MAHITKFIRVDITISLFVIAIILSFSRIIPPSLLNMGDLTAVHLLPGSKEGLISSKFPQSPYIAGWSAYQLKDYQIAILRLSEIKNERQGLAHYFLMLSKTQQPDWQTALREMNLNNRLERQLYIEVLYRRKSQLSAEQINEFEDIIKRSPDMVLSYANFFVSDNHLKEALYWVQQISTFDRSVEARIMLGRILLYSGNYSEAEKQFQQLYQEIPSADITYLYGKSLFNNGEKRKGISLLESAIEKSKESNTLIYLLDLGDAYLKTGQCMKAKEILQRIAEQQNTAPYQESINGLKQESLSACQVSTPF